MAGIEVPKVYGAIAEVVKALSVEKGGTLPGNMGGKSYYTAADLNAEVKRLFVQHGLIIAPQEELVRQEILNNNNRLTIAITIKGTYEIIAVADGSSITIGGIGDGLAIGTSVSANIASTNSLKNALLRFLLVSEQSVEDAGKNGIPDAPEQKVAAPKSSSIDDVRAQITAIISSDKNSFDGAKVNALGDKITGEHRDVWGGNAAALKKVLKALEDAVAAEQISGEVVG
jgi:hypothetical protein